MYAALKPRAGERGISARRDLLRLFQDRSLRLFVREERSARACSGGRAHGCRGRGAARA